MTFKQLCEELEASIQSSYEDGVSLDIAEKLAARFLYAQLQVSTELKKQDLNARMRKTGLKAIRAAIYMEAATKTDKKPSDTLLENQVNMNEIVQGEQESFDLAEVERDELERLYNVFQQAHHYFKGLSRGSMG